MKLFQPNQPKFDKTLRKVINSLAHAHTSSPAVGWTMPWRMRLCFDMQHATMTMTTTMTTMMQMTMAAMMPAAMAAAALANEQSEDVEPVQHKKVWRHSIPKHTWTGARHAWVWFRISNKLTQRFFFIGQEMPIRCVMCCPTFADFLLGTEAGSWKNSLIASYSVHLLWFSYVHVRTWLSNNVRFPLTTLYLNYRVR